MFYIKVEIYRFLHKKFENFVIFGKMLYKRIIHFYFLGKVIPKTIMLGFFKENLSFMKK